MMNKFLMNIKKEQLPLV